MKNTNENLIYALFVLASNNRLKQNFKHFKEYPSDLIHYCPIKHAKEFKFQWEDRSTHECLQFWTGKMDDIDHCEDQITLTLNNFKSESLGNEFDMLNDNVLIVPLSFNNALTKIN